MGNKQKLKLTFTGRRSGRHEEDGPYVRVHLVNGNTKLSPEVVEALSLAVGDTINFTELDGTVYMGQENRGFKLGKGFTTTATTISDTFADAFKDKIKDGDNVVYAVIDLENPIEAETEGKDGPIDIVVYEAEFKYSEQYRSLKKKKKTATAEAEDEDEDEVPEEPEFEDEDEGTEPDEGEEPEEDEDMV